MSLIAELLRDLAGRLARLRSPPADPATGPAARPPGGEVHLGDLATALGTLHWQGPDQAQVIAGCLGLGLHAPAPPAPEPRRVYDHRRAPPPAAARWRPGHPAEPWRPDGSPLLAATDLGIQGCGGAHPHPGWDTLARACATAGGPLLILIPWPPARWPAHLPGRPVLIHWAPDTGAGLIRRALGPRRPVR